MICVVIDLQGVELLRCVNLQNFSQLVKNVVANSTLTSMQADGDLACEIIELSLSTRRQLIKADH